MKRAIQNYEKEKKVKRDMKDLRARRDGSRKLLAYMPRGSEASVFNRGKSQAESSDWQKAFRKATNFRGQGDYMDSIRSGLKWGSRLGHAVAGAAGGYMGSPGNMGAVWEGARHGYDSGADFSKYMGWGDYGPVSSNQIVSGGQGSQQQISVNQDDLTGDIHIQRTEFVGNVTASNTGAGSSPFQVVSYPLNVGLAESFPFLSQIAANYTLYEPLGIMYQFKPTSGEFGSSTSNALGKVIMATQYDPDALPFSNAVEMENYDYANSSKPSCGMIHGVECAKSARLDNMLYVRTGTSAKSQIFTDIGDFQIATEGLQFAGAGTAIVGELWVTYRVRLSRANLGSLSLGSTIPSFYATGTTAVATVFQSPVYKSSNTLSCLLTSPGANIGRITFPSNISAGTYQIIVALYDGSYNLGYFEDIQNPINCKILVPTMVAPTSSTVFTDVAGVGLVGPRAPTAGTSGCTVCQFQVSITAPGALVASVELLYLAAAAIPVGKFYCAINKVASV